MAAKVDLHLHSRFSDRSAEWLFRRFDFPDSYSAPRGLYRRLKEKGMTFLTFTDHNRADGCLEIADLPGSFVSVEVGAEFPEDHVAVHFSSGTSPNRSTLRSSNCAEIFSSSEST